MAGVKKGQGGRGVDIGAVEGPGRIQEVSLQRSETGGPILRGGNAGSQVNPCELVFSGQLGLTSQNLLESSRMFGE